MGKEGGGRRGRERARKGREKSTSVREQEFKKGKMTKKW